MQDGIIVNILENGINKQVQILAKVAYIHLVLIPFKKAQTDFSLCSVASAYILIRK